jgi:hypothetical protein
MKMMPAAVAGQFQRSQAWPKFGIFSFLALLLALAISIGMMLAQFRLFSIDKTLKRILLELEKQTQPSGPPAPESEAELGRRRAAIAEVQNSWLIK